jgi:hypothetical protein
MLYTFVLARCLGLFTCAFAQELINGVSSGLHGSGESRLSASDVRHLLGSDVLSQALRTVLGSDSHRLVHEDGSVSEPSVKAAAVLLAPWMGQNTASSRDAWVHAFRRLASEVLALSDVHA